MLESIIIDEHLICYYIQYLACCPVFNGGVCVQGVKVHFALDASGIFHVDKADVVFEPEEPEVLS